MREHIHADAHDEHTHQPAWNEPSRNAGMTTFDDEPDTAPEVA